MDVSDRPRVQAARGRRDRMTAAATAAKRRLLALPVSRTEPPAGASPDAKAEASRDSAMHTVHTARHPDDIDLSWEQVCQALRALKGSRVAVRVI